MFVFYFRKKNLWYATENIYSALFFESLLFFFAKNGILMKTWVFIYFLKICPLFVRNQWGISLFFESCFFFL